MKRKSTFIRLVIPMLVLLMAFGFFGTVLAQPELPNLIFVPDKSVVTTCEESSIAVHVEGVEDLTAYDLLVHFDPEVVEVTGVVSGGFLVGSDEDALFPPTNGFDNSEGFVRYGEALQRPADGEIAPKSGDGDLILITLRAMKPNEVTLLEIDMNESVLVRWADGELAASPIEYTASVGIVRTQNCVPEAYDQTVFTLADTPVSFTLTGSDPNGDPITYNIVTLPINGTLKGTPPDLTYTPGPGFTGLDSFTFTVYDGEFTSDPATVTITTDKKETFDYYFPIFMNSGK